MVHAKVNPKGIDIQIQRIQQYLHDKLVTSWSCDIQAYGRAYVDEDEGSVKPRAYLNTGEYKELLIDDSIKGAHFFFIEDKTEALSSTCMSSSDIDLIFIVNDLKSVRNDVPHYADEEIKEEVKSYVKSYFSEMSSIVKGMEALNGFDISELNFVYPYYVFKISGTINNY